MQLASMLCTFFRCSEHRNILKIVKGTSGSWIRGPGIQSGSWAIFDDVFLKKISKTGLHVLEGSGAISKTFIRAISPLLPEPI